MIKDVIRKLLYNILVDLDLRGNSVKWANWMSQLGDFTCQFCVEQHGKIVDISALENKTEVLAHPNCRCVYVPMRTVKAGTASDLGFNGADAQLFYRNRLPDYYVNTEIASKAGWAPKSNHLDDVLPGKMIGGDVFKNKKGKLPNAPGRVWFEADIDYAGGGRNRQRVVYSNDGLIFATYDHYHTFYEVTQ